MKTLARSVVKKRKPNPTENERGISAVDSSFSNVSNTCVVSSVISKIVTNNSRIGHFKTT
jgi:hypothetical protein